jgi:hypothetical protein
MMLATAGQPDIPKATQVNSVFLASNQNFNTGVFRCLVAVRCASVFKNLDHRAEMNLAEVWASSDLQIQVTWTLFLNPTFADPGGNGLTWTSGSTLPNSYASFTTSATTVSGGTQILSFSTATNQTVNARFDRYLRIMRPGDIIALCCTPLATISNAVGGSGSAQTHVSMNWCENL